jgi:hypothetical protein
MALAVVVPVVAQAADRYYVGPNGGSWSDTANWSAVPAGAGGASVPAGAIRESALTVNGLVTIPQSDTSTSSVGSLSVTGRLDLKDNKMIVTDGDVGTFDGTSYSGLTGQIASAYNFGAWDGTGIYTSMPDAQADRGITTIAIATAEQVFYAGGTFGGVPVATGDVLLMYTYAGDLNLDGLVDAADYGVIDNWVQFPGSFGYANGDLNYDGVIDAADYGIIDNTIQLQGPPIPAGTYPASTGAVAAVPEPASLSVLGVAAASLLGHRSRRSRRDKASG